MSYNLKWNNIRLAGETQQDSFEELVCQLARKEKIKNKKHFVQLGRKDGGLECFWELNDGSLIGWQAKFFTQPLQYSHWIQIRNSIKSAAKNYDSLSELIIAIPYKTSKSMNEVAQEYVNTWKKEIDNCPKIKFWWDGDLKNKLIEKGNDGFLKFWFDDAVFTDEWFQNHAINSIKNLKGENFRVLNIETDNKRYFDSICRNDDFKNCFLSMAFYHINYSKSRLNQLLDLFERFGLKTVNLTHCIEKLDEIADVVVSFDFDSMEDFDFNIILKILFDIENTIDIPVTFLNREDELLFSDLYLDITLDLDEFGDELFDSRTLNITNKPILLFHGEAGIGKSFLFRNIAEKKLKNKENCILLLGKQFISPKDPRNIILEELGLKNYNFTEFLDALECKAYADKSRILILIDALNEGLGIKLWNNNFNGFINEISKRKTLSFAFSIRDAFLDSENNSEDYSKLQLSEIENLITKIKLFGFSDNYNAKIDFFKEYGIKLPNNYLLSPELDNPLFLRIFCETISNSKYNFDLNSIEGFSGLMGAYIGSLNVRFANKFGFHPQINLVQDVLVRLIEFKTNHKYITITNANNIIMDVLDNYSFKDQFLTELINEGVLIENSYVNQSFLDIQFQRFEEYIKTINLVKKDTFDNFINKLSESIEYNPSLLEMFSIYIPENYNFEIYNLINDDLKGNANVVESFIKSLKWRKDSLDGSVLKYVSEYVINEENYKNEFLNELISLASVENHFFNATFTHKLLLSMNLSERDIFWAMFLKDDSNSKYPINSLLEFAFLDDHSSYSDESIKLSSIMISWFLTSTKLDLRDKSTFALVNILKNKLNVLKDILVLFEDVDDFYILERLYAVAYACVLLSKNLKYLEELGNYVYETIFDKNIVCPHLLIRDYARNIVEICLTKKYEFKDNSEKVKDKIRPSYNSDFPNLTQNNIEKYKENRDAFNWISLYLNIDFDDELPITEGGFAFDEFYMKLYNGFAYDFDFSYDDLMNYCISKIFDMGYSEEAYKRFDEKILGSVDYTRNYIETIGEKYCKIIFYKLLAIFSDKFEKITLDLILEDVETNYVGPWQGYLRNIDPTIEYKKCSLHHNLSFKNLYVDSNFLKENWIENSSDLPNPKDLIESHFKLGGYEFNGILLNGYLNWIEDSKPRNNLKFKREIRYNINSFLVKKELFNEIILELKDEDFEGQWLPEPYFSDFIFNKEFYQSIAFNYANSIKNIETNILSFDFNNYEVELTTNYYNGHDKSILMAIDYLKLNQKIFNEFNLKQGDYNSFIYDCDGNVVGFDAIELDGFEDNNFIFDKNLLLNYLEKNDLKVIFTVFSQKFSESKIQTNSGVYYFENGKINGSFNG